MKTRPLLPFVMTATLIPVRADVVWSLCCVERTAIGLCMTGPGQTVLPTIEAACMLGFDGEPDPGLCDLWVEQPWRPICRAEGDRGEASAFCESVGAAGGCIVFDLDRDGDVDLQDVAALQRTLSVGD